MSNLISKGVVDQLKKIQENCLLGLESAEVFNRFLLEYIDPEIQQKIVEEKEIKKKTEQNRFLQLALSNLDINPISLYNENAVLLRRIIWKWFGIKCDQWDCLEIRNGIIFDNPKGGRLNYFNPSNIEIVTGGERIVITGMRRRTYMDATGKLIIYAPMICGSGVCFFTHDHDLFTNPSGPMEHSKIIYSSIIIYPDTFIGDDVYIFGPVDLRTMILSKSIKSRKKRYPPFSVIGGIGPSFSRNRGIREIGRVFIGIFATNSKAD